MERPSYAEVGAPKRPAAAGGTAGAAPPALFRGEVLVHTRAQWLGPVLLAPRVSHRVFTIVGLIAAAAILGLLFGASFTRTASVSGWLVPKQGVVRVMAPRAGVVTALHVAEGAAVRKGQPLLTLSDDLQSAAYGGVQAEVSRQLAERRQSLADERRQQQRLLAQQKRALADRVAALHAEAKQLEREVDLLNARVEIARRNEALHREQFVQGYISEMRLQLIQSETLEQVVRLGALERALISARRERTTAAAELNDLPLKQLKELALIDRGLAQLGQERAESEGRREIVVSAPGDGTVTAIHAIVGAGANAAVPLLSIVPADDKLEAHLYGPSRAMGFVQPGQQVRLRYQAYPYQRFGHYEGTVASVSRSAVNPSDLPVQIAGLTGVNAATGGEPMYRVVVEPASQSVQAYGQGRALQPGMTLDADVSLERRRLAEWVLEPIYAITGKWSH
jgi:membrane fusion protein